MTLEDKFHSATNEWKKHCREQRFYSFPSPYIECEAYKKIVSLGKPALPLIRNQMAREYETMLKYNSKLKQLTKKVLGEEKNMVSSDDYNKMCRDEEYRAYEEGYSHNITGSPGIHWCLLIKEIVPEFGLPIDKKESPHGPVREATPGFVALDVPAVHKATIEWLDAYFSSNV